MKKRILIIDDDRDFRALMNDLLSDAGYHVKTCGSGREAMECMQHPMPDLIVLDLMIPGENGFEICRKLTDDPRTAGIPIFILTGRTNVDCRLMGFSSGARRYITKPCDIDELLDAVSEAIGPKPAQNIAV